MAALTKLTPATALPSARQLVGELGRAVREASGVPGLDAVAHGVEALEEYSSRTAVDVDLVVVSSVDPGDAARVAAWIGAPSRPEGALAEGIVNLPEGEGAAPLRVAVRALAATRGQVAGAARAPVLVAVVGSASALDPESIAAVEGLMEDRPLVVLLRSSSQPSPPALEDRARSLAWTAEAVDLAALPEATLQARLAAAPWGPAHDLLRAHSTVGALASVVGVLDIALQQQARDIKVKRAVVQARLGPTKPGAAAARAANPAAADPLTEIKARVQRHSQEFERGASERVQDLLGPAVGSLTRETETMLLSLDELHEDERSTKIETRVPTVFEAKLLRTVRERIGRHCAADVVALNDLFRLLAQEIERQLTASQGPPFVSQFSYLTEDRVRRVVEVSAGIQVTYRGELPRRGFGEYFASVRKYSMLLVMGASMFGLSSAMRAYREFTVPLTILLVLFGTYSVATSTRQQRIESLEKELDAARNAIRPELKRVFADIQKNWSTTLSQFMNEQVTGVLAELDLAIKSHQARRGAESNPERDRLQRQVQALEAAEKKLTAPGKAKDTLLVSVAQMRGELKALFPQAGSPAAVALVGAGGLQDARARLEALKAEGGQKAASGAAASALEAARSKLAALKAQAESKSSNKDAEKAGEPAAASARVPEVPEPGAKSVPEGPPPAPSAAQAAKAKLAELQARAAERKAAAASRADAPQKEPVGPRPPSAAEEAKAKFAALKAKAAERKAARAGVAQSEGTEKKAPSSSEPSST